MKKLTGRAPEPHAGEEEIRPQRPFPSLEAEVFLNLLRTGDYLQRQSEELLKPHGLSPSQYNVLRILRGAGRMGLSCREIAARMLTRDPDITRLLDRLEKRGLLRRRRESHDRRVITVRVSDAGLETLRRLDAPIAEVHRRALSHLGKRRLATLIRLLEAARSG